MAHFSARPRLELAVEMKLHTLEGTGRFPIRLAARPKVTQQVCHRGWAKLFRGTQWQTADRSQLLLELAGDARVKSVVAGVVRTRCEFIDQEVAFGGDEEFHTQHANDIQGFQHRPCDLDGAVGNALRYRSRRSRDVQDLTLVLV